MAISGADCVLTPPWIFPATFRSVRALLLSLLLLGCSAPEEAPPPDPPGAPTVSPTSLPPGAPPPAAQPFPEALQQRLAEAWTGRDPAYTPRTHHVREDGSPQFTNRLFLETSPYLLQHAHNPVNWFPWGLMISAFARAALTLGEPDYAARAAAAAEFVLGNLRVDGTLRRAWLGAPSAYLAYLEDHAFLAQGLLDLFEATGEVRWLHEAIALDEQLEARYEDPAGGWFVTANDGEALLVRQKPSYDGASPTGTSVHVLTLYRLLAMTGDDSYRVRAEAALKTAGAVLERQPLALSELLLAVDFRTDRALEIVIVSPESAAEEAVDALMKPLRTTFVPNRVVLRVREGAHQTALEKLAPLVAGKAARDGLPTAYVCEQGACQWPTTDPVKLAEQIQVVSTY